MRQRNGLMAAFSEELYLIGRVRKLALFASSHLFFGLITLELTFYSFAKKTQSDQGSKTRFSACQFSAHEQVCEQRLLKEKCVL